jgi:hypothetical protein
MLMVCKHCDSILDERWWKAMIEAHQVVLSIYDQNGTFKEKLQSYALIQKELNRLKSLPREKQ